MRFTELAIKNLKPKSQKYYVRADMGSSKNGFALCVYPTGVKSWFFIYTFEKKRESKVLGNYPDMGLAKATDEFDKYWQIYKSGINPKQLEVEEKELQRLAPTVDDLCTDYIKKHAMKKKKSWQEDKRALDKEVIPFWGKRKAADIKKRDVVLLLEKVDERGAPVMANRLRALIQKMFNFAVERDILEFNPCAGVKPLHSEKPKERALSDEEIKTLWENLNKTEIIMSHSIKQALKLTLVTAQRPGEVIGIHKSEIKEKWWTIPSERSKNGKTHRVYLTDLALEIIGSANANDYLFPSPKNEDQPIDEKAMACALRRNIKGQVYRRKVIRKSIKKLPKNSNRLGIDHFTPHDLRRTAASLMAQSGILYEHRERVLNHTMGKMDSTYNQHDFDAEKQKALETLEIKLRSVIGIQKCAAPESCDSHPLP